MCNNIKITKNQRKYLIIIAGWNHQSFQRSDGSNLYSVFFMRIEMTFQETEGLVSKWSRPGEPDRGQRGCFSLLLRSHNLKNSQYPKLDVTSTMSVLLVSTKVLDTDRVTRYENGSMSELKAQQANN